tara:strand:+ start:526 stop:2316 length:1791 start_codon:yes stop_codon:yes gene_type:complete
LTLKSKQPWTRAKNLVRTFIANNTLDLFPLRHTARNYSFEHFSGDIQAGLNAALLAFPQGIAYAMIGGLPVQYGIYGATVAAILGAFIGKTPFLMLGPTNATAVMLMSSFAFLDFTGMERVTHLPLLLGLTGLILIIGAYLKVANLIQYISRSVVTGYISAAGALIIANQIKNILGFSFPEQATTFYEIIKFTIIHSIDTQWQSLVLAVFTLGAYIPLKKYCPKLPAIATTLIVCSAVAFGLTKLGWSFSFINSINVDNWDVTLPTMDSEALGKLASAALAIALLCLLESSSVGKSLSARAGRRFDANQEMLNIGVANLGCALLSGMPASGSPTRSMLSYKSGARSPLASGFNGLFCLVGVFLLGPYVHYIPEPSLAVLIVVISLSLFNRHVIRIVTRSTSSDATVYAITFIGGLIFPLETAIYFGTGASIALFLRKAATPEMVEYIFDDSGQLTELDEGQERPHSEISIVHVEGNLFFGAAELFRDQIRRICEDPYLKVVVLKIRNAYHLDATSVMALEELINYMREHGRTLLISEAKKDVIRIFKRSKLIDTIGRENIFPDVSQNPTLSSARALKRAQELLGPEQIKISIYADG